MTTFRSRWDDWEPERFPPCTDKTDKRASVSSVSSPPRHSPRDAGLPASREIATLQDKTTQKTPILCTDKTDKSTPQALKLTTDTADKSGPSHPSNVVLLRVPEAAPEAWVQGVADMLARTAPRAYTAQEWAALRERAYAFLRDHAAIAHRLGWTALELWGVHKTAPRERMDCTGLLALNYTVVEMYEDRATVETPSGGLLTYRRRSSLSETEMCLLWELP